MENITDTNIAIASIISSLVSFLLSVFFSFLNTRRFAKKITENIQGLCEIKDAINDHAEKFRNIFELAPSLTPRPKHTRSLSSPANETHDPHEIVMIPIYNPAKNEVEFREK